MKIENKKELNDINDLMFLIKDVGSFLNRCKQDYIDPKKISEILDAMKTDIRNYKTRIQTEIYSKFKVGEIYKVEFSDGISGVNTTYYSLLRIDSEEGVVVFDRLDIFIGDFNRSIGVSKKETEDGEDFLSQLLSSNYTTGKDIVDEYNKYLEIANGIN